MAEAAPVATAAITESAITNTSVRQGQKFYPTLVIEIRFIFAYTFSMLPAPPCPELARELRPYKRLREFFNSLEPGQQEMINRRILDGVKKETRKRRAAQEAERLMEVMEA